MSSGGKLTTYATHALYWVWSSRVYVLSTLLTLRWRLLGLGPLGTGSLDLDRYPHEFNSHFPFSHTSSRGHVTWNLVHAFTEGLHSAASIHTHFCFVVASRPRPCKTLFLAQRDFSSRLSRSNLKKPSRSSPSNETF